MRFTPSAHPPGARPSAHRAPRLGAVDDLAPFARRQTTLQVSPGVPNVCGTIREKFQVRHGRVRCLYDEYLQPPSLSLSASARRGRTADETRLQERRTRVILIRTRPRGVEVKAGFLLGVSRGETPHGVTARKTGRAEKSARKFPGDDEKLPRD